jgi:hypothetical protein
MYRSSRIDKAINEYSVTVLKKKTTQYLKDKVN